MLNGERGAVPNGGLVEDEIDPTFLQRSISAPPTTDHSLGQNSDRLGLDYYYYYQPNSLNPRLPKQVPPAPGLTASQADKPAGVQDDSGLFTHFPQPSKPLSASIVGDYLSSLEGAGASGGAGSPLGGIDGPSPPQARAPTRPASAAGPGPLDPPLGRPSPIGTALSGAQEGGLKVSDLHTKSLIEMIQEDFPRTPSPVFANQNTSAAAVAQAINLGMATAASAGAKVPSPSRVPSSGYLPSSASHAPPRSGSAGPGMTRAGSHGHMDMLASGVQGLSLAAPADEIVLGPGEPAPEHLMGRGGPEVGLDHHGHLPPRHPPARVMYQQQQQQQQHMHEPSGPPPPPAPVGMDPYGGAAPSAGYHVAGGGGGPVYPEQVFYRVAQGGAPYRQDLHTAVYRVPAEYVAANGDPRHGPPTGGPRMGPGPEYVSVIPTAQGYVYGPGPHQRIVPSPYRDHRMPYPAHGAYPGPLGHPGMDPVAYGRLQQEAHERGFKLVPKDPRDERGKAPYERRHRDRERMMSSSTLEEFRNNTKNRPWDIRDIAGDIVEFCQDQHGSRFIQQKLEVATDEEKELIFKEILPRAHTLMTDVFGNYVIQKVLEHGTPDHRDTIASILTGHAVQLALQMYGCRVIQKALEVIGVQRLLALVSEFEGHVLKCVHDQNGNHVIQKCIEVLSLRAKELPEYASFVLPQVEFIVQAFVGQVEKFSTHPYGCRVIQRILEHCTGTQKNVVLDEIRKCTSTLIQDQYGNYVVQHVMKHGRPADRQVVVNEVKARMLLYSQHKFASNVVEKCLQYGSKQERNEIIEEVVRSVIDKSSLLQVMVRDPYGNYVVQKILDIADDRQQETLCQYLKQHAAQLKRYTYGKHILVRLEKISGEKLV